MTTEKETTQPTEPAIAVEPVLAHRFNSIGEIVKDPYFIDYVEQNLSELRKNRNKRPEPKPGYHYKRDWYDRMSSEGHVNSGFFIKNIENIWLKKSSLSSQERHVIQFVCDKSFQQTLIEYSKQVAPETVR